MPVLHAKTALTPQGWQADVQVVIGSDGKIAAVGPQTLPANHRMAILLPAPVNLHSHAFQRAMAGLTEQRGPGAADSFWTWRRLMFRFLDQLTPDDVQAIAAQVYMEMLQAGFAAVAEFHYLHHDQGGVPYADMAEMSGRIVAAAGAAGIGLTLLPVHYQFGGCDGQSLQGGQQRFGTSPDQFIRLHQGAAHALAAGHADYVLGTAPHSLRAVSKDGLRAVVDHAATGPIHLHLAEQMAEVDEVQSAYGARPIEWLLAAHDVNTRWCAIHCTQMTDGEARALATSGAVVGLCPLTEASLGDGIFNARPYLAAGGRFGLGSDSNIQISLFEEAKALEYSQRLASRHRAVLATPARSTGRAMFDGALAGGAQAGGRASGAIAPGMWADMIGLDDDNAHLPGRRGDQILDSLIFGGGGAGCITDVFSAGRHMVRAGRHIHRDAIEAGYKQVMRRLKTDYMTDNPRLSWTDVRDIMRGRILARDYPLGARLPRDEGIAQELGCARTTVHRAMQELEKSGLIERRRKGGSYVKADPIARATLDIPLVRSEVAALGRAYGYVLILRQIVPCPEHVALQLNLPQPQEMLQVIALHLADGAPFIFENRWISPTTVPEIMTVDLAAVSANEWLLANRPYSRLDLSLYAENAGGDIAAHMDCPTSSALLVTARATWIADLPITYVQSFAAAGYRLAARGFSQ